MKWAKQQMLQILASTILNQDIHFNSQKNEFFHGFHRKHDQIHMKLLIWSHLQGNP